MFVPAVYKISRNSNSKLLPTSLSLSNVCVSIVRCKVSVFTKGYIGTDAVLLTFDDTNHPLSGRVTS